MSLPQARRLFARLMEKSQKEKLSNTERKLLIQARQVLRAEKKGKRNPSKITFVPIREPNLFGYTATVGNKKAEVVRVYTGSWHAFLYINGQMVRRDSRDTSKSEAVRQAKEFLLSNSNPKWFPVTKRKAKRLGEAYKKAYRSFVRQKNPVRGTLIYGRVLKIYAQKTSGPYKGQRFVHTFKPGAIMIGMPDGSLRIVHS